MEDGWIVDFYKDSLEGLIVAELESGISVSPTVVPSWIINSPITDLDWFTTESLLNDSPEKIFELRDKFLSEVKV